MILIFLSTAILQENINPDASCIHGLEVGKAYTPEPSRRHTGAITPAQESHLQLGPSE